MFNIFFMPVCKPFVKYLKQILSDADQNVGNDGLISLDTDSYS